MASLTPMMQQYMEIKKKYQDCILFYRLGDFYEMFFGDATIGSQVLGLTLTGRDCGQPDRAPMCGIPFHSCDSYIAKLVAAGYKVAICEQMQDPAECKGIVERKVIRVITPGTITIGDVLEDTKNNFLVCIYKTGMTYGMAAADVSTGELYATYFNSESAKTDLLNEIAKYNPSEIIYHPSLGEDRYAMKYIKERYQSFLSEWEGEHFEHKKALESFQRHMKQKLSKAQLEENALGVIAVGALLQYLESTQMTSLDHMSAVEFYQSRQFLGLDSTARYNLELVKTMRENGKKGSLLGVLDKTCTFMGGRMISNWIQQPLVSCGHITRRHSAVEELTKKHDLREQIRGQLKQIKGIERLVSKIDLGSANGRDLVALKESIAQFPALLQLLSQCESSLILELSTEFDLLTDLYNLIQVSIVDDPPFSVREGSIIKPGYDKELDSWKNGRDEGSTWLKELEVEERETTGIKNLKVGFNKVFGYYIEVTKSYYDLVPEHYIRKQTLANCERYITPRLKEIEDVVLRSDEKIVAREYHLFCDIRDKIKAEIERIQRTAKVVGTVDVLASLAEVAVKNNYVRPEMNVDLGIEIRDGRHPVVEQMLTGSLFVPNDTCIDGEDNLFSIITGANMAGKSTYMRQVALIVIMAQMGSFVPASFARIGIVDKIFTRIGASDDLSSGQSTFMVEMNEVANIIANATSKSLLILDEIGRGTSTYDGLSIAWSVVEYIADKKKLGARTLFATHYHELAQLEEKIQGVKNYCIVAKKRGDDIVFLRKIVRGGADESYGIEVAKLAGVPDAVIARAKKILASLEASGEKQVEIKKNLKKEEKPAQEGQFGLFDAAKDELIESIKTIDINVLSPIEAMNKLYELKTKADQI